MRSIQLQTALTDFVEASAGHLQAEILAGAEVQFELEQRSSGRGSPGPGLYCYRPLTAEFIAARAGELKRLPSYGEAASLLAGFAGLERYLAGAGADLGSAAGRRDVGTALGALLCDVFAEQTDFQVRPERLAAALERLQASELTAAGEAMLVATLHGVTLTSQELAVAPGLTIAQPHALGGLPPGVQGGSAEEGSSHLVVVLSLPEQHGGGAIETGTAILTDLLRALRLFGDGRVALGPLAWARIGGGSWSPLALGTGGRPHGMLVITAEQEDELRAFCSLVSRRAPQDNELAWALRRFELGCELEDPFEALTDHLLALRALLEPEGPSSGLLAGRLAALCATPELRLDVTARATGALALERGLITGASRPGGAAYSLVLEISGHLRALLRDMICGHLGSDLIALADELLLEGAEPEPAAQEPAVPVAAEPPALLDAEPIVARRAPVAAASAEELFGDPRQAQEILDVFL